MSPCAEPPSTQPLSTRGDIRDVLAAWDRASFGIACRKIEILLIHGENEKALGVFRGAMQRHSAIKPTLESPVADVLPYRLANMLDAAGYMTLAACHRAPDADLLALRNMGVANVDLLRQTIRCVLTKQPLPYNDDLSDLEPEWPLSIDDLIVSVTAPKPESQMTMSKVEEALSLLLDSRDDALAEIDGKIEKLTVDIDNLKRMRKLLSPAVKTKSTGGAKATSGYRDMAERIVPILREHGPLRSKQIATLLGDNNFLYIARCAGACPELLVKNEEGLISLANAG